MKSIRLVAIAWGGVLCLGVSLALAAPPFFGKKAEEAETLKWAPSLQAAHQQASAQNKPILIVFGADWCVFCKKLEKQTLENPEMVRYINAAFVPVHLDLDEEKRVAEILEVAKLPCTVVISPNADLLGRIDGYQTPHPYYEKLVLARQHYQKVQAAQAEGTTVVR